MHRSGLKSQLRRKRRDHLLDELSHRKSTNRLITQHDDWEGAYRPLKSRGMARPDYVNSRQEQYKLHIRGLTLFLYISGYIRTNAESRSQLDQQLMRELRTGKDYETKWFTVSEIGIGDVAVRIFLKYFKTYFNKGADNPGPD